MNAHETPDLLRAATAHRKEMNERWDKRTPTADEVYDWATAGTDPLGPARGVVVALLFSAAMFGFGVLIYLVAATHGTTRTMFLVGAVLYALSAVGALLTVVRRALR